jgi:type I restriction enzyme S subunit
MRFKVARVGDLVELCREHVAVDEAKTYRQLGIYSWGKGIIRREPVPGSELSKLRYFSFPPCALLLSNIQAWEGAVAVTSSDEAGFLASNRFLPYLPIDENSVDVGYLRHYFLSELGLTQIRRASPGTQVRNRTLGIKLFEDLQIPLPELDEQRRIATHLGALESASTQVGTANKASEVAMRSLTQQLIGSHGHAPRVALASVLRLDREWFEPQDGQSYDPVGVRGFGRGLIRYPPTPRAELPKLRFFRLHADRLVVRNIKAWEGAVALTTQSDANRIGSNRFLMYASDQAKADLSYILGYLLSEEGLSQLQAGSPGSADRNRTLSISNFEAIEVPLPSIEAQHDVVRLLGARDRLVELVAEREKLAQALPASARNEIFSRMV